MARSVVLVMHRIEMMLFEGAACAREPELVDKNLPCMRRLGDEGMIVIVVTHELGFAYNFAFGRP